MWIDRIIISTLKNSSDTTSSTLTISKIQNFYVLTTDEVEQVMIFVPLDVSEEMFLIIFQLYQEVKLMR